MVSLILAWLLSSGEPTTPPPTSATADSIARLAPEANRRRSCSPSLRWLRAESGVGVDASRLAFIDYSRPSTNRAWGVRSAQQPFALRGSRRARPRLRAEPREGLLELSGSHASSLRLFLTRNTYQGRNGYSLRMEGLEPGITTLPWSAQLSSTARITSIRSPPPNRADSDGASVPRGARVHRARNDRVLKDGQFVFAYYPDADLLAGLNGCAQADQLREEPAL